MSHPLDRSVPAVASALRSREVSALELVDEAIARHGARHERLHAYMTFDADGARAAARLADERLAREAEPPPLCGIPVSAKDLYGAEGLPTYAGTRRQLPASWSRDAWLVARLRSQGAVLMGKTHTVELAYGGVGMNPNWETPRNAWDAAVHRIPGGSSSGAAASLHEGSALVALGTDTGGSIRIPASFTGVVGHKTTKGLWPTDGVVPLSHTLDTVGALTRTAEDSAWFFSSVQGVPDGPEAVLRRLRERTSAGIRLQVPECETWDACQADIATVLRDALEELAAAWWPVTTVDGALLDEAYDLYVRGGISGVECLRFLQGELPEWVEILHPIVGDRIRKAADRSDEAYREALAERERLAAAAHALFEDGDVLVLPTHLLTPPPVTELSAGDRYASVNATVLRPTCPASILGLCAVTIPVGLDRAGLPVGLQIVAPGGADELALATAWGAEGILGTAARRLGPPPRAGAGAIR